MSTLDHALAEMRRRGIERGGEIYLTPESGIACIAVCQEDDLAVVGVEGFVIDEGSTVPLIDQIADFSQLRAIDWSSFRNESNREAIEFINQLPRSVGLHVSLTLLSRGEWEEIRSS